LTHAVDLIEFEQTLLLQLTDVWWCYADMASRRVHPLSVVVDVCNDSKTVQALCILITHFTFSWK